MPILTVLDEETTGKLDPAHRIIELSMRQIDTDSGEEKRSILMRFNPERNIDAAAFRVHGISLDELKGESVISARLPEIAEWLSGSDAVAAHNGIWFDFPFLRMEFERNGVVCPPFQEFDTMVEGTFATDLGKNPSLKELCFALDVDYDESAAHKGDYDTAVLRDCIVNGLRWGWYKI
jgi:DNA polymerase-3 subunit epsilon